MILKRVAPFYDWSLGTPFEGEPPEGSSFQVWNETKNAPVSPIYGTEDGVIHWLMSHGYTRTWAVKFVNEAEGIKEN